MKNHYKERKVSSISKALLSLILIVGVFISNILTIDAKNVGEKNESAKDSCELVYNNQAPTFRDYSSYVTGESTLDDSNASFTYDSTGYSTTEATYETLIPGSVYRGGNAKSGLQANGDNPAVKFDNDVDDFASVLPYGNTFIDTSKLTWNSSNAENFIVDVADSRFVWMAGENYAGLKDATGNTEVNTDPMGDGRGLQNNLDPIIAYIGPIKGYLGNTEEEYRGKSQNAPKAGQENIIVPENGGEYLYQFTFKNAVTLKDGTKGNLIIAVTRVELETTATQDKALIALQKPNQLNLDASVKDKDGNAINTQKFIAKTEEDMREWLANTPLSNSSGWTMDKSTGTATGAIIDLDIRVTDVANNPVDGSISYAAKDMDLESYQDLWGRSLEGEDRYKFNEALTVVDGALSYAVVPNYDHANGTSRATGWIPTAPAWEEGEYDSPLHITKTGSSANANGVRFSGIGNVVMRDQNGTFEQSIVGWGRTADTGEDIRTVLGDNHRNSDTLVKDIDTLTIPDNTKKQLQGKILNSNGDVVRWGDMTNEQIFNYIGLGSYGNRRGDDSTYDTGFATLLNARNSKLQWSGSMHNRGNIVTKLFDTSIYTYVEQTHGTGGGVYFEAYNIADACKVNRAEGTVTMGKGTDATLTAVPEDGYRVDTIQVGQKSLGEPVTFTVVYDENNAVKAISYKNQEYPVTVGNSVTIDTNKGGLIEAYGNITFDVNPGGSIDVTLPNIQDARHVHVDFTADYYFYKTWKSKDKEPSSLLLTATPYIFRFKDVTINNVKYKINGNTFTGGGKTYELENNALTIGEDPNIEVFYLEGNDLVSYKYTDPDDPDSKVEDKRFSIRLDYEKNGDPVEFEVVKADADNPAETNVIKEVDSEGYTVWKIRYPANGYTTKSGKVWKALPIETDPSAHNINHVERKYWFVTEDAPGWALVKYDNSEAEAPGVIDIAKGRKEVYAEEGKENESNYSAWAFASVKDFKTSGQVIKHATNNGHAYMSVFSDHENATTKHDGTWGGEIVNIPLVVVNAEKTWDDFSNAFKTRQDVWFHIDAEIDGVKTSDVLPPQKMALSESGDKLIKTWGDKKEYGADYLSEYSGYEKVKVVGTTADLPKDIYFTQDKNNIHKFIPMTAEGFETVGDIQLPKYVVDTEGTVYYVNELTDVTDNGKQITYYIRETDGSGNDLSETNDAQFIKGYKTEIEDGGKATKDAETVELDGVDATSYTNKIKNILEKTDFTVTKIWKENGAPRTHTLDSDVELLKDNLVLKESDKIIAYTSALKLQPNTADEYVPASGETPASGTLETENGKDETEVVFTWHNIPKYIGDGNGNVHEAVYSVAETALSGYNAPTYSDGTKALNEGTITNEVTPPVGTPKETYGPKNKPQEADGKSMFTVTTATTLSGEANTIVKVELLDEEGNPATEVVVEGGKYTIADDGKITFTPDTDFVGDPPAVNVRGTDGNGLTATTTYTPHVVDNEKTVKRTITYEYFNGDPVLDSEGNPKTVVHSTTFVGSVNPETGEVTYDGVKDPQTGEVTPMDSPNTEFPQVDSDPITGYTPDKDSVNKKTVTPSDSDWEEKVIYSPLGVKATPDKTYGLPNEPQTGTVTFTMETETYTDGTPNEITVKLVDPNTGEETDEKSVSIPGQGTYTLNDDGTITFTPEEGYVGNPTPIEVTGTDRFGTKAKTTYTPHIVDPTDTGEASRTIHYRYINEEGEEVTGDTKQTVTLTRHATKVDPKTGEATEWGPWEPQTFPAITNPDDKVDGRVWFTDDNVGELTVNEPGDVPDEYVIYEKIPYTVTYLDGSNGKSDGKGDQEGEDYGNEVTGGNTVTPDKGYKFTGTYTYVIKDHDGNVIGEGTTDDPTSIEITGNIEFTPVYEKLPTYSINYDKNGGTGHMGDNNYLADDETKPHDKNTFTRKGYKFTGFHAYITNPETGKETPITDDKGNPIVFTGSDDMAKYFEGMPDKTSIRMEAQWKPEAYIIKYDANGGQGTMDTQYINGADGVANSKENKFTRPGYTFKGFKALLPDGTYLKDENGRDIIFPNTMDFFDYLAEYGDGAEVTLIAQWEPLESATVDTSDKTNSMLWAIVMLISLALATSANRIKRIHS